jgi:hypothetical protein
MPREKGEESVRRIIEDETKTATFRVDVTESNVEIRVQPKAGPQGVVCLSPEHAEHLMGLLSEALYGMRRVR